MICQKNLRVQSVTSIYNQEVNLQIHLGFCCLLQFFVRKTLTSESLTLSKQYQQLAITIFVAHQLRCLLIASKYIPFSYSNLLKRDPFEKRTTTYHLSNPSVYKTFCVILLYTCRDHVMAQS
jgi:hypothetical protein